MRSYILSKRERKLIQRYLDINEKPETFRMLKLRIKRAYPSLTQDLRLIEKALKKFEQKPT